MIEAVVLAAGLGSRFGYFPKILLNLGKISLLFNHIKGLDALGAKKINFVVGFEADKVKERIKIVAEREGISSKIRFIENPLFREKGNGYSAYLGIKKSGSDTIILVMGDHLLPYKKIKEEFSQALEKIEKYEVVELVDENCERAGEFSCTKLKIEGDFIVESSKNLRDFNAIDTGFFLLRKKPVLASLSKLVKEKTEWNDLIEEKLKSGKVSFFRINPCYWFGINTKEEFEKAKKILEKIEIEDHFFIP